MNGHQKGFTLLEIVLVLVLISLLSVLIGPRFVSLSIHTSSLQEAKSQFVSAIATTRNKAIFTEQNQKIEFFNDHSGTANIRLFKNDGTPIEQTIVLPVATLTSPVTLQFGPQGQLNASSSQKVEVKDQSNNDVRMLLEINLNGYVTEVKP